MGIFGFLGALDLGQVGIEMDWARYLKGTPSLKCKVHGPPHGSLDLGQIGSIRDGQGKGDLSKRETSLSAAGERERWQTNQAGEETAASFCIILKFGSWELGHDRLSPTTSKIEDAQIVQCYEKHLTGLRFFRENNLHWT